MRLPCLIARCLTTFLPAMACVAITTNAAHAQFTDLFGQSGSELGAGQEANEPVVQATLRPSDAKPGNEFTLSIQVTVPPEHYTYSMNRAFGGATTIRIEKLQGLTPTTKKFQPDHPPQVVHDEFLGRLEKYFDQVTWSQNFRMESGTPIEQILVDGVLEYQVCNQGSCRPYKTPFQAALVALTDVLVLEETSVETTAHPFSYEDRPKDTTGKPQPISFQFELLPEQAKSGDLATLKITARIEDGWHTFALTQNRKHYGKPTVILIESLSGLKPAGPDFQPEHPPEIKQAFDGKKQHVHHHQVSWQQTFEIQSSEYGVAGEIRYQMCDANSCRPAQRILFALGRVAQTDSTIDLSANVEPGANAAEHSNGELFGKLNYADVDETSSKGSLPLYLLYAFLGGLILNVMPCVLPVIAIKVMSFVQQAGESRRRILALNVAYAGGVVSVFLLLASLAAFAKLGWGGLFQSSEFNLIMACLVFTMGLSLLGLFEIPVPGFVGSAAGSSQKEGLPGAFLTGIFATVLATPCSGPFLGTTLGWSVQQSTLVIYLIWATMGFGMAFPYLLFGMFPAAIKWLPKPGNWMVRLKEFAGLVLMATVIFIVSFLEESYTIPLLAMLFGISLGAWMIGNLYELNSSIRHKMTVRVTALLLTAGICTIGYNLRHPRIELPWENFTEQRLEEAALAENRTVLVDFTADW